MRMIISFMAITGIAVAQASGLPEPVVEYEFDGSAIDLTGNGYDAVANGTIAYSDDSCGEAALFNNPAGGFAATQYFTLPDLSRFGEDSFTIALRMRSTDTTRNNGRLFGNHYNTSGVIFNYNRGASPYASISVNFNNGSGLPVFFDTNVGLEAYITDGDCHWMILVVDREQSEARAYIDGYSQTKDAAGLGPVSLDQLRIGGSVSAGVSTGTHFAARSTSVERFLVYSDALTHAEILTLLGHCTLADLAAPFGVLDLADISAFTSGFLGMDHVADLNADGIFDLADINLFVNAFVTGCP